MCVPECFQGVEAEWDKGPRTEAFPNTLTITRFGLENLAFEDTSARGRL